MLAKRAAVNIRRDVNGLFLRILQMCTFAVLLVLFLPRKLNTSEQSYIQDRTGILLEACLAPTAAGAIAAIATYPVFRDRLMIELVERRYSASSATLANVLVEAPLFFLSGIFFSIILYPSVGLQPTFSHFLVFAYLMGASHLFGECVGTIASTLIHDQVAAASAGQAFSFLNATLASGLFRPPSSTPLLLRR